MADLCGIAGRRYFSQLLMEGRGFPDHYKIRVMWHNIMRKKNKSQAVLMYVALIAFVATALVVMAGYIQSKVQGNYKTAGDVFAQ
jgi:hypothetical protein